MRTSLLFVSVAVLFFSESSRPAGKDGREDVVAREVRQIEDQRVQAMLRNDFAALERILADDLIYTHSSGRVETKAEFLNSLKTGQARYETFDREGVMVRSYGSSAVVTGTAKISVRRQDQIVNFQIRFIDVYVERDGRWQMVAWQSTRLQP